MIHKHTSRENTHTHKKKNLKILENKNKPSIVQTGRVDLKAKLAFLSHKFKEPEALLFNSKGFSSDWPKAVNKPTPADDQPIRSTKANY